MSPYSRRKSILPLLAVLPLSAAPALADQAAADDRLEESRSLTAEFASRMQTALVSAMSEGGPATAIPVCRDEAPLIASDLSRLSGARVQRTTLLYRNPGNAPEPWQSIVLRKFEADAEEGEPVASLEYFERLGDGGVRYMRAIPTGGVCLACHGTGLSPDLDAVISESYPHDLARGYELGDIRGAFSVTWPAPTGAE